MAVQFTVFTFQDATGAPLAGGRMTIRLNTDASTDSALGPQVVAGRLSAVTLDNTGSCSIPLWPNDQLSPPNTVYLVKAYTVLGQLAWSGPVIVVTGGPDNFILQESGFNFILEDGTGDIALEN